MIIDIVNLNLEILVFGLNMVKVEVVFEFIFENNYVFFVGVVLCKK